MAKVGDSAHTQHGLGVVKEIDSVRGSKQFRVAGKGFDVWVPEVKLHVAKNPWGAPYGLDSTVDPGGSYEVNESNSTTLPWNGSPQFSNDLFRRDQTIQPGEFEIDPDERLHSSDSRTQKNKGDNRPYPGPNPDLFAKDAAVYYGEFEDYPDRGEQGADDWHEGLPDGPERTFDGGYHSLQTPSEGGHAAPSRNPHSGLPGGGTHRNVLDEGDDLSWDQHDEPQGAGRHRAGYERPAGLSNRYAHVEPEVNHHDPITAFRRDPEGYIHARNYDLSSVQDSEYLNHKFADYSDLTDHETGDPSMKTAAWTDVRSKAQRLRHEGRVHIKDISPDRIYATVEGDNGTYDTMIAKGGSMGGWGGGQSVSNWHCGCEWGRWAFQRRFSYVGRLCSHAYAAYLDMQSAHMKENPDHFKPKRRVAGTVDKFKTWLKDNDKGAELSSVSDYMHTTHDDLSDDEVQSLYDYCEDNPEKSRERNFDIAYTNDPDEAYKTADILNQRPQHLMPHLQQVEHNEGEDAQEWSDVEKDERETTGPDDIVHFSAIARRLHADDGGGPGGQGWGIFPDIGKGLGDAWNWGAGQGNWSNPMGGAGEWARDQVNPVPGGSGGGQPPPSPPAAPGANLVTDQRPAPAAGSTPGTATPGGNPAMSKGDFANAFGQMGVHPTPQGAGPKTVSPNNAPAPVPGQPGGGPAGGFDPSGAWKRNTDTSAIPGGASGGNYTVKPGDTLSDIAERSGLGRDNYQQLADSSGIKDPNMITPGQQIKLPGGDNATGRMDAPGAKTVGAPALGTGGASPGQSAAMPAPPTPAGGYKAPAAAAPPPTPAPSAGGANSGVPAPPNPGALEQAKKTTLARLHYAENDDDDPRPDTGEAASMLDRLRELSDEGPHFQHQDERNEEVRDLVEKLQDAGVDASQFVASLRYAVEQTDDVDPEDSNANFLGKSFPNWADEPFQGSGPDPKYWIGDSASYVDKHERPDFEDVDDGDGDIIKFNDSRSKPQQGPGHNGAFDPHQASMLLHGFDPQGESGYFNPNNPSAHDWEEGSGDPFMDELGNQADKMNPNPLKGMGDEGEEGAEGGAEGDLASTIADNPELLAVASNRNTTPDGGFSLEAFDRGEFSFADSGGGELRRASRVGGGPSQQVRVDRGSRGWEKENRTFEASAPSEDSFGYNGEADAPPAFEPGANGADIVAAFQRSAGAESVMGSGSGPRPGSLDDFSSSPMVQGFLRTAGRKYSEDEMRELEQESHVHGARNLPTDEDLAGTHYLSM